jgi:hypothetical protein
MGSTLAVPLSLGRSRPADPKLKKQDQELAPRLEGRLSPEKRPHCVRALLLECWQRGDAGYTASPHSDLFAGHAHVAIFEITLQMADLPSEVQSLLGVDWVDRSRQQLAGT